MSPVIVLCCAPVSLLCVSDRSAPVDQSDLGAANSSSSSSSGSASANVAVLKLQYEGINFNVCVCVFFSIPVTVLSQALSI